MNKCDGIKILELDPKRNLEGSEYVVNYFDKTEAGQVVVLNPIT
jgi:hypothetical protein